MNGQPVNTTDINLMWGYTQIAEATGTAASTWRSHLAAGRMPTPDRWVLGHPLWNPAAFMAWYANRPGRGNWAVSKEAQP